MTPRLLLISCLLCMVHLVNGQLTYETVFVDYDSAWEFESIRIIPIKAKGQPSGSFSGILTLEKALETGQVTLTERGSASTENVHWVRIRNHSGKPVFVASGEIITGGRQDRMLSKDTVIDPMDKDQYIPAMCVEEGRWSDKEKKFTYYGYSNPSLRKVMDQSGNQVLLWKEIYHQLDSSKIRSPSLAYAAWRYDKKNQVVHSRYLDYFLDKIKNSDSTILGVVCISGDKILGTDIFAAPNLFEDAASSLLSGYIEEALKLNRPAIVPDDLVMNFMDMVLTDEVSQEEYCRKNGKLYKYKGKVFHLNAYHHIQ